MNIKEAFDAVNKAEDHDYGKFYGASSNNPLGVGQIYDGIRYPLLNRDDNLYDTREGCVYVLTHECDISQDNKRPFNDFLILCPIIKLEDCVNLLNETLEKDALRGFLTQLGKDRISRVAYFPPMENFNFGGVIYLNQLSHAHIDTFFMNSAKMITSVTTYGLRIIDYKITNHLLRPKSASLPLIKY